MLLLHVAVKTAAELLHALHQRPHIVMHATMMVLACYRHMALPLSLMALTRPGQFR